MHGFFLCSDTCGNTARSTLLEIDQQENQWGRTLFFSFNIVLHCIYTFEVKDCILTFEVIRFYFSVFSIYAWLLSMQWHLRRGTARYLESRSAKPTGKTIQVGLCYRLWFCITLHFDWYTVWPREALGRTNIRTGLFFLKNLHFLACNCNWVQTKVIANCNWTSRARTSMIPSHPV